MNEELKCSDGWHAWGLSAGERCQCGAAQRVLIDTLDDFAPVPRPDARLVELAREAAFDRHHEAALLIGQEAGHSTEGDDQDFGFSTCLHPDCVLVREGQAPA